MAKIYICKEIINKDLLSNIKAMITFSETPSITGIANTKHFNSDEARKGLEQLKRWVSTGAFKYILIDNFLEALEKGNSEHIKEWLADHSSEPDFPSLILVGDRSSEGLGPLAKIVSDEEELKKILNT